LVQQNKDWFRVEARALGTNPWFKKPRAIGEKVDSFRMVLKVGSGRRSKENL
jgi:hypothetical protein